MGEVHKTQGEILSNEMDYWLDQKEKAGILLPHKDFLESYFEEAASSCNKCYGGEEEQIKAIRENLNRIKKNSGLFTHEQIYITKTQQLCDYCKSHNKPMQTLSEFTRRTLEKINSQS